MEEHAGIRELWSDSFHAYVGDLPMAQNNPMTSPDTEERTDVKQNLKTASMVISRSLELFAS
jgi:hypothetical protein